jgi:squalene-hopene/tetraprenyl-beta-curcumene cyclase
MDWQSRAYRGPASVGIMGVFLVLTVAIVAESRAQDAKLAAGHTLPSRNSPTEPLAPTASMTQAAAFLDAVAVNWTRERRCGTCHTNYPYLMARPVLKEPSSPAMAEVRAFFEQRVAHWDDNDKGAKPKWDAEVVSTAAALAFNDAATTGTLHPLTQKALDRVWTIQNPEGGFHWLKCDWPPLEYDDYYGAIVAALGAGHAPGDYAQTQAARAGLARLRDYFAKNPAPNLHHQTMLLWASTRLDGLMTTEMQKTTISRLRQLQRADGGWNLSSLGNWNRRDGTPNDPESPTDGYATGLVVFVLRQAGIPASDPALERGVAWLRSHQRASGRWFTRSLTNDNQHYITHAGTAYAVLALHVCGIAADESSPRTGNQPAVRPQSSTTARASRFNQ